MSLIFAFIQYLFLSFFSWTNGSTKSLPRKDPIFRKSYFYAKGEDSKAVKEFRKDVYFPIQNRENLALIHYIGNDRLSLPEKHGNGLKPTKLFFRTKPSVFKKLSEQIDEKAPHKLYKESIAEQLVGENQATDKPRNIRQVQNIKASTIAKSRVSRDAIMNVHALAYEKQDFIWHIKTYPDTFVLSDAIMNVHALAYEKQDFIWHIKTYPDTFVLSLSLE